MNWIFIVLKFFGGIVILFGLGFLAGRFLIPNKYYEKIKMKAINE